MPDNDQANPEASATPPEKKRRKIPWLLLGFLVLLGVGIAGYFYFFYDNSVEEKICDVGKVFSADYYDISDDGQHIVLRMVQMNSIIIWDKHHYVYDKVNDIIASRDGKHLAYVASNRNGDKRYVVFDNVKGPTCKYISNLHIVNTDIPCLLYSTETDDGKYVFVYNNIESRKYDNIFSHISIYDGHWMSLGRRDNKWVMIYDGNEVCAFDATESYKYVPHVAYAPNGHWACSGYIEGKKHINIGGIDDNKYDEAWEPVYSKDGLHFAFLARNDNKAFAVIDSKEDKYHDEVYEPVFNDDGSHYAYWAKDDKGYFVVKDGVEGKRYKNGGYMLSMHLSSDGKHILYEVKEDNSISVVIDEVPIQIYDDRNFLDGLYYDDINKWAYVGHNNNKDYAVINGRNTYCYDSIYYMIFNDAGSHWSFIAQKNNKHCIVYDGIEGPLYDVVTYNKYSPDGTHLAYCAEDDGAKVQKWFNEKIYKLFDLKKRNFIVLDGKEQRSYQWVSYPVFTKDGKMIYYGIRDNVLYRITKKL